MLVSAPDMVFARLAGAKLNTVSHINMFGWDLTRLTTRAAEMDCMQTGERNAFVWGKKNAKCMHVCPHGESVYSYRIPYWWSKCFRKCL